MCVSALPACANVLLVPAVPVEEGEDVGTPATGVLGAYELPCGYWQWNLGPLQDQQVLLTAEPSL